MPVVHSPEGGVVLGRLAEMDAASHADPEAVEQMGWTVQLGHWSRTFYRRITAPGKDSRNFTDRPGTNSGWLRRCPR